MSIPRRWRVLAMLLSVLPFLASCGDNDPSLSPTLSGPTAPTAVTGGTGVATTTDSAKCYSVQFQASVESVNEGPPLTVTFAMSGDLVGHFTVTPDFTTYKYSGPKAFYGGTESWNGAAEWAITGGSVPGLSTFQTALTNRNLISAIAGSPSEVFENIGSHRATGGVGKANFSYKGTAGPAGIEHRYWGVICP